MRPDIKFCGLTRAEDAEAAARLGARYAGVIFAGGPRNRTPAEAAQVLRDVPREILRVGVFGRRTVDDIAGVVAEAGLDIVQLHADPMPAEVKAVRLGTDRPVWAVARVQGEQITACLADLFAVADAIVLDSGAARTLGGTGMVFPWDRVAEVLTAARGGTPIVLAGGLTPANVGRAIEILRPDVVDVSSGVESAPGVKDHARMQAFSEAVRLEGVNR